MDTNSSFNSRMQTKFDSFFQDENSNGLSKSQFLGRISLLTHAPTIVLTFLLISTFVFDMVYKLIIGHSKAIFDVTLIVISYILGLIWMYFFKYFLFYKKRYYLLANNFISIVIIILCLVQSYFFYYITGAYNFTLSLILYPILVGIGLSSASPQKTTKKVYYSVMVLSFIFALVAIGLFEIIMGKIPIEETKKIAGISLNAIIQNIFNSKYPIFSNTLIGMVSVYVGISSERLYVRAIRWFNTAILFISKVLSSDTDIK